jgi:hypothetical protein
MCVFPLFIFLIANSAKQALIKTNTSLALTINKRIIVFGLLYLIIVALISFTGFFSTDTIPPRILLVTTLPLLLVYILFVSRSKVYKLIIHHIDLSSLIRLHIFRLIGVFFLITYYYNALPKYFAITGGLGDIFAAITAIFGAYGIDKKKSYAINLAYAWNIVGLIDIINVAFSAVIATKQSITNGTQSIIEFSNFPFCWIPAFAPATIIFLHISIFKKLRVLKMTRSKLSASDFTKK